VARRVALAGAFAVGAYLVGFVALHAQSAASAPRIGTAVAVVRKAPVAKASPKPGTLIAVVRREILVRSAPNGPVLARVLPRTEFGSQQTLAVTRATRRGFRVITTSLPNGRVGWVARTALGLRRTRISLDVDLSQQLLRVRNGSRVVRRIAVGIGAPGASTPTGRFAITDKLDGAAFSPVYGCCILALSGHQTHLPRGWTGGDLLAIHAGPLGAVSTGCLHASTADLRFLMRSVPLGAQVVIHP
jgi:lipoprotein-anchoring transpeptidase ErfK/SrfK